MFDKWYAHLLKWAAHPKAVRYLAWVSFIESSVFPIPPDTLLLPMSLSKPQRCWYYAGVATLWSVLGGLFGYLLGFFIFEWVEHAIHWAGYRDPYEQVVLWFRSYGFWAVFLAGVTPIPYKLFTIAAGMVQMSLLPFVLASIFGRGFRFFLVAGVARYTHQSLEHWLKNDKIRILMVILTLLLLGAWAFL